tara:strand:- start:3501 stop:3764 length:264 start_codon:yes stop_codon:yes gene_type:complete
MEKSNQPTPQGETMTTFNYFDINLCNRVLQSDPFLLGNEMDLGSQIPDNHIHAIAEYLENSGGRISSDYDYFNCSSEILEALDRYLA